MRLRRIVAVSAAMGTVATGALVVSGTPAYAENIITVTTTADLVAADGVTSLREAFTLANGDGQDSRIVLGDDLVYGLCGGISPSNEDLNSSGDLDHTDAHALVIEGHGSEIRAACPGNRVIDNLNGAAAITIVDLGIKGGDVTIGTPGSGLRSEADTTLTNVLFTDNTGGSALEVGSDANFGKALSVTAGTFTDNGSGLRLNRGHGTIDDTDISFNQGAGAVVSFGQLTVDNSSVRQNGGNGVAGIDGSITVTNSVVSGNGGVGIRNTGNSNTGFPLTIGSTVLADNHGGVDCSFCTNLTISDSTVTGSRPAVIGGFGGNGVRFQTNQPSPTVTITDTLITDNRSADDGAGVRLIASGSTNAVTISNTSITANRTSSVFDEGGGIYGESVALTLSTTHVDGNFAKPAGILVGGSGGGVSLHGGSLIVTGSTLNDNYADSAGGGAHLVNVSEATFTDTTIADNTAHGSSGGGIDSFGTPAPNIQFLRSSVTGNSAATGGGGIAAFAANTVLGIARSTVADNTSTSSNGGGVYMNGASIGASFTNSTVSGNSAAAGQGGGILKIGTGTLLTVHGTIVDNSAAAVANVVLGASVWTSFGTVVALPGGGGVNCTVGFGTVTSLGYDFSGTNTCGFGLGPGDVNAGGNPLIGPLAMNGGPTPTRALLAGSPLLDAIPNGSCQQPIDQRGVSRPQGGGCDTGAVEGTAPFALTDRVAVASGVAKDIAVLDNDKDVDRIISASTLKISGAPSAGSATVAKGRIIYQSRKGFVGTDRFSYEVCTSTTRRTCTSAAVSVTVTR